MQPACKSTHSAKLQVLFLEGLRFEFIYAANWHLPGTKPAIQVSNVVLERKQKRRLGQCLRELETWQMEGDQQCWQAKNAACPYAAATHGRFTRRFTTVCSSLSLMFAYGAPSLVTIALFTIALVLSIPEERPLAAAAPLPTQAPSLDAAPPKIPCCVSMRQRPCPPTEREPLHGVPPHQGCSFGKLHTQPPHEMVVTDLERGRQILYPEHVLDTIVVTNLRAFGAVAGGCAIRCPPLRVHAPAPSAPRRRRRYRFEKFEPGGQRALILLEVRVDDACVQLHGSRQRVGSLVVHVLVLDPGGFGGLKQAAEAEERVVDVTEGLCGLADYAALVIWGPACFVWG